MGRTLPWTVGLGSGRLCSEARLLTPARVCLCVSLIFSLSVHLVSCLCAPVRPWYFCAPPLPLPLPGPCPDRPSSRRPHPPRGSRGPPVPSPGRRGARQLLLVGFPGVPASPGGLRARRQPGRPCPALLRAARLPAPQAAAAGTHRSEVPSIAPTAGPRRPGAWPRAAPAPPSAPGLP